jgi:hypothetical protein
MPKDIEKVQPTSKVEVASGIGPIPSETKLHNQLAPSDQSGGVGSASASKPQSTKRRPRRNSRYPARLDDGAARHPKWKRPNAQRSGVFAEPLILPGEDPREFEAIHSAWIEEWTPSGPSEQSKIFGIADAEWRKTRSRRFAQAKAISNSMRPDHPAFDEARGLIAFGYLMCREPETAFAEHASKYLRADKIRYLNQNFRGRILSPAQIGPQLLLKKSSQVCCQARRALPCSIRIGSILPQKHFVAISLRCTHSSPLFICGNSSTMTLSNRSASTQGSHG